MRDVPRSVKSRFITWLIESLKIYKIYLDNYLYKQLDLT